MLNKLNQIFATIYYLDGFFHWVAQRLTALSLLFTVFFTVLFNNLYFFLIAVVLLTFHISVGIRTLIDDYIHDDLLFLISTTFLRIILLFLFKTILIIFIC